MKRYVISFLLVILVAVSSCKSNELVAYSKEMYVLGTVVKIKVLSNEKVDDEVFEAINNRLIEIENKMTINSEVNSEIQQVNDVAGIMAVNVSEDTYHVVEEGLYYSQLTKGKFDITIGPLVKLWGIGFENEAVPKESDIIKKIELIDYNRISMQEDYHIYLENEGMMIDLGGIAKGYAADEIVRIIKKFGFSRGIIDVGGNVYCLGDKGENTPYNVGIRDPYGSQNDYVGFVSVKDKTIVSSGIYEKNFEENGVMYHHIYDIETGYPVNNELMSVAIVTDESIKADALSTGVFALGVEEGLSFVESYEDIECIMITKDKEIIVSKGLKSIFNITNEDYECR